MVALDAVEVLEQNVQGRQVDLIVPSAEAEQVNEIGNSDFNRNHEFKTVKSLSLPDLRKFYTAREFFPDYMRWNQSLHRHNQPQKIILRTNQKISR